MDEIIAVIFAILVFAGPILFKILGAVFEGVTSSPKERPGRSTPQQTDFTEKLRRHRLQQQEAGPVDAQIIDEALPTATLQSSPLPQEDSYYSNDPYKDSYYSSDPYNTDPQNDERIELRDDRMDEHLHEVFDHKLGSLGGNTGSGVQENVLRTEGRTAREGENLAAEIAAMMTNTADMRKAFIIGEILQRPATLD